MPPTATAGTHSNVHSGQVSSGGGASLAAVLAEAVRKTQTRESAPKDYFRMSSIGHCPRAQIAMRAGLPPTNPWARRVSFKMWGGTVLGREIQRLLEAEGFLEPAWTEKEVRYRSYVGHLDGATTVLPVGRCVVELKTSDDSAVTKPDWPEHYQWQGLTYCLATGLDTLLVFQFGKNQGLSRERVFPLTEEWTQRITEHIDLMERLWGEYARTQVLPPHSHVRFGWQDKTCAYLEGVNGLSVSSRG